jgi:hypothetical protein
MTLAVVAGPAAGARPTHPTLAPTVARLLAGQGVAALPGVLSLVRDAVGGAAVRLVEVLPGGVEGPAHAATGGPRPVGRATTTVRLALQAGGRPVGRLELSGVPIGRGADPPGRRTEAAQLVAGAADIIALALLAAQSDSTRVAAALLRDAEADLDEAAGWLHDGPVQSLLAARVALQLVDGRSQLEEAVGQGLAEGRRTLSRLQTRVRCTEDLPEALAHLADQFGLEVTVESGLAAHHPPARADRAAVLYRVAQAAAADAAARGGTRLDVRLGSEPGWLWLQTRDDGPAGLPRLPALLRWLARAALVGARVGLPASGGVCARVPTGPEAAA